MSAPRLNRALLLETPDMLSDGAGGYVQGWLPVGTLWAEVTRRSGRETTQMGAPISTMAYLITVRGAPVGSAQRPAAKQRFRDGTRIFTIDAVTEHDPDGRYLICFAKEEQLK